MADGSCYCRCSIIPFDASIIHLMIAIWRTMCLVGLGGIVESLMTRPELINGASSHTASWAILFTAGIIGWSWAFAIATALRLYDRVHRMLTGRPSRHAAADPRALAAEIAALQAQIAHLRDTAASYDLSLDDSLHRLDERLQRVEGRSTRRADVRSDAAQHVQHLR